MEVIITTTLCVYLAGTSRNRKQIQAIEKRQSIEQKKLQDLQKLCSALEWNFAPGKERKPVNTGGKQQRCITMGDQPLRRGQQLFSYFGSNSRT